MALVHSRISRVFYGTLVSQTHAPLHMHPRSHFEVAIISFIFLYTNTHIHTHTCMLSHILTRTRTISCTQHGTVHQNTNARSYELLYAHSLILFQHKHICVHIYIFTRMKLCSCYPCVWPVPGFDFPRYVGLERPDHGALGSCYRVCVVGETKRVYVMFILQASMI